MTYNVFSGTLNPTQSINLISLENWKTNNRSENEKVVKIAIFLPKTKNHFQLADL